MHDTFTIAHGLASFDVTHEPKTVLSAYSRFLGKNSHGLQKNASIIRKGYQLSVVLRRYPKKSKPFRLKGLP